MIWIRIIRVSDAHYVGALTDAQIVVRNQAGGELAVEEVVRLVDGAHARVRIVVGIHAEAERIVVPQWFRAPMRVVVAAGVVGICALLLGLSDG